MRPKKLGRVLAAPALLVNKSPTLSKGKSRVSGKSAPYTEKGVHALHAALRNRHTQ